MRAPSTSPKTAAERKEQNPPPQAMAPGKEARLIEAGTGHGQFLGLKTVSQNWVQR